MKSKTVRKFSRFPLYLFLFSIYPPLALFAANIKEVEFPVVFRPILFSILVACFFFLLLRFALKDWQKAAVVSLFMQLLFFSYGHVYNLTKNVELLGINIGRHRILIVIYLFLACAGIWFIIKKAKSLSSFTGTMNVITLVMVGFSILQISWVYLKSGGLSQRATETGSANQSALRVPDPAPDVYYIILDMYTRSDVLMTEFNFDNRWFIDELKDMGFFVADCSRSNYYQTELSLSSSLNMDYLENLDPTLTPGTSSLDSLPSLLKQSRVRRLLEEAGYKSVAFETGYYWDSWTTADYYLKPSSKPGILRQVTPFESLFLKTTAALILTDSQAILSKNLADSINNPFGEFVDRQRFILDQMETIATLSGPKFVFAHIMLPHFPFIFKADGSVQSDPRYYSERNTPVDESFYREGYTAQTQFVSTRIIKILQNILEQSKRPVIIVIQGDHGAREPYRAAILNAYYLPRGNSSLYPTISPVNTFRVIFNQEFGENHALLDDLSFESNTAKPFDFKETFENSPACIP